MSSLTGHKELDRMLRKLADKTAKKAAAGGVRASLTPVAQAMRKGVTASGAPADVKRAARKTIKAKVKKSRGFVGSAKVGFGVGKQREAKRSGKRTGGVGISGANVHWFVLGTGQRQTASGRSTGSIDPALSGIAADAVQASRQAAVDAAKKKIRAIIEKDARQR